MAEQHSEHTAQQRAYRELAEIVAKEDAEIDLTQAALLIATIAYPDLDSARYLTQLSELAQRVRSVLALPSPAEMPELPDDIDPLAVITAMNTVLFEQEDFHGNYSDYYNPNNSFLNQVLEQKTGIPITLSLLYIEVGKRVGIQLDGIGLPFHFVVGCRLSDGNTWYIDPFERGQLMSEQQCRIHIRRLAGGKIRFHAHWFHPVTHKQLLIRMLTNLKNSYMHHENFPLALAVCDRLVLLAPTVAQERRDRGIVHLQLKHYVRALYDLKAYTEMAPEAEDRKEMLEYIRTLRQTISMMN